MQDTPNTNTAAKQPRWIEGRYHGQGRRIALVVSRFNSFATEPLTQGALDCLVRHGVDPGDVEVCKVPGAWELPLAAKRYAASGKWDGVIALGAVIRGDTPHFEYVSAETSKGIAQASLETGIPISFGVLTTNTTDQALDRAGIKSGNKGWDAALGLLEMIDLLNRIE
ncbi:6,7-dimethyl-8-ribityllumazine synthase [Spirochaeta lutea]|uniref:6,7-dimethyl-8-ribityllumazine synthase n=1 Tax=Spirochaeta lutea TaxID=1480694 RepID=UPI00068A8709|nr:6,7-dimethyl-8-ribityllumazine synthase [Spirochaeta lutea]